ncbi:MAG: amidohydrolase family protein [Nitrospinota bacterium]
MKKDGGRKGISRRSFLRAAGAGTLAAGLGNSLLSQNRAEAQKKAPSGSKKGGRILAKAAFVASLDDSLGTISRGAVIVEGDKITAVGPYDQLSKQGPFSEEIGSLRSDLLMPGLTSSHHHAHRAFRDGHPDKPLEKWLPFRVGPYAQGFSNEQIYLNKAWATIELIRAGCTSVLDWHTGVGRADRLGVPIAIKAYREIGMRVALALGVTDQNRLFYLGNEKVFNRLSKRAKAGAKGALFPLNHDKFFGLWTSLRKELTRPDGRVQIYHGPAAPHTCSDALLRRMKRSAEEHKAGIQIHLDESPHQRAAAFEAKGKSNVQWMDELGFWGPEVSCAHGVWLSEDDLQILKNRGTTVVHDPGSNLRLFSGIAPVHVMRKVGTPLAFGADGVGINDNNDLMMDIRLADMLQRLPGLKTPRISAENWFKIAIQGGARVLLQENALGSLSPGKNADFILVDLERMRSPSTSSDVEPLELLIHRGFGSDVHTSYVAGRPVMRSGKILNIDEKAIAKGIKKAMAGKYPFYKKVKPVVAESEEIVADLVKSWDLRLSPKTGYRYNSN